MNKEEIIRMAREAGIDPHDMCEDPRIAENSLEHFAALVAAQAQQKNQPPITHAEGCWSWSEKHYMCALAEIARLRKWHADAN